MKSIFVFMSLAWISISCSTVKPDEDSKKNDAKPSDDAVTIEGGEAVEGEINIGELNLAFVSPTEEVSPTGGGIQIDVQLTVESPTAKWSLYYTPQAKTLDGASPIATDLSPGQQSVVWSTEFVPAGTYFIFASVTDGPNVAVYRAPGAITIDSNGEGDNRTPVVIFDLDNNSPVLGDRAIVTGGQDTSVTIRWTSADPDPEDTLTYKVESTSDNGTSWDVIADDLGDDIREFEWIVPGNTPRSARFRVRITATDEKGKSGSVMSDLPFGVTEAAIPFAGEMADALADNCLQCHSEANPSDNFRVDLYERPEEDVGPRGVRDRDDQIVENTRPNAETPMPPSGELDVAVRDMIQLWRWTGRQETAQ